MITKKAQKFAIGSVVALSLFAAVSPSITGIVSADSVPTITQNNTNLTNVQEVEGVRLTTTTSPTTDKVSSLKIENLASNNSVTISNDGSKVNIIKSTYDKVTGTYHNEEQSYDIDLVNQEIQPRAWTAWSYTNVAIGARVFAYAVDTAVVGLGAAAIAATLPGAVAAALGISATAAKSVIATTAGVGLGYLATIVTPGTWLANKLDTSGNGWIGIYYRHDPATGAAQWKTM